MVGCLTGLDSLDECPLVCVNDVNLVPLEEYIGHWYTLTCYDIARAVLGVHAGPLDRYKEIRPLKHGNNIPFTFVFKYGGF